jgi:uncharacterized membrane protein
MDFKRLLRHLVTDHWSVRRAFPPRAMRAIEAAIAEQEQRHLGELRFAVEASLPLFDLLSGVSARQRAVEQFSRLRIWDTEHNSGVLIYLLLADRQVEIVADRGIHSRTGDAQWQSVCSAMQRDFGRGRFEEGVIGGVRAIGALLSTHFPGGGTVKGGAGNRNELPDRPVVL